MPVWLAFVESIRVVLFAMAHVAGGSMGAAIFALSVVVRLALLPLAVKVALRAKDSADTLRTLEPELKRLQVRHKNDPARLITETRVLHRQHGVQLFPRIAMLNLVVQMPLGLAVYRVVIENVARAGKFLWMADLRRHDVLLTALTAGMAALGVAIAPSGNSNTRGMALVTAVITVIVTWRLAAGVGLYWVGSSVVGVAQSLIVRRITSRHRKD